MAKPRIPDLPERLDFIWRQLIDPCDAPLTLWIEKMLPHAWELILELYAFDMLNTFSESVKPRLGPPTPRSRRHWGGGKKGSRNNWRRGVGNALAFDPGQWLGERMPWSEDFRSRPMPPGTLAMWTIYGLLERVLLSWMVLDMSTEFAYRWASSMAQTRYCRMRQAAVLLARNEWYQLTGIFGWSTIVWHETLKIRGMAFWNGVGATQVRATGIANFSCRATCVDTVDPAPWAACKIKVQSGPNEGQEVVVFVDGLKGGTYPLGCALDIAPGDLVLVENATNGIWDFEDAEFYVHAHVLNDSL